MKIENYKNIFYDFFDKKTRVKGELDRKKLRSG